MHSQDMARVGPMRLPEQVVSRSTTKRKQMTPLRVLKRMKSEHLTEVLVHCYVLDSKEHTKEKIKMQTKSTLSAASN